MSGYTGGWSTQAHQRRRRRKWTSRRWRRRTRLWEEARPQCSRTWRLHRGGGKKARREELRRKEERTEPALGLALPVFNRSVSDPSRRWPRPCHGRAWPSGLASNGPQQRLETLFHSGPTPMGRWSKADMTFGPSLPMGLLYGPTQRLF
jgi:hypothetical protein